MAGHFLREGGPPPSKHHCAPPSLSDGKVRNRSIWECECGRQWLARQEPDGYSWQRKWFKYRTGEAEV